MCSGNLPAAPESADLIAIIHPERSSRPSAHRTLSGRLRLSNSHTKDTTTTHFQNEAITHPAPLTQGTLSFHIHRFGQPICEDLENPIMHSFPMTQSFERLSHLGRRLDLSVGGEGIIGRTVSITDEQGELLGQGIIGRI